MAFSGNGAINNHDFKPTPVFLGARPTRRITSRRHVTAREALGFQDGPQLFFGFELEVERNNNWRHSTTHEYAATPRDAAQQLTAAMDPDPLTTTRRSGAAHCPIYCKYDGSLRDGFEIVSHPFTWEWLKANRGVLDPIFRLRNKGFRSYQTTTCGLHVHMTRAALGALGTYKLLEFAYRWPAFWLRLSARRNMERMNRWASPRPNDQNGWRSGGGELKRTTKAKTTSPNRYSAVNVTTHTVEIRIFRGTLSKVGFMRSLETVLALSMFAKYAPLTDLTPSRFFAIVAEHAEKFPTLVRCFQADVDQHLPPRKVRPETLPTVVAGSR